MAWHFFYCIISTLIFYLVSTVITSAWPNNAQGIWLSTSLIACLRYYRVRSGSGATLTLGCLAAMFFSSKNDFTSLTPWHLHRHCGFGLSVLRGERETQMLHIIQAPNAPNAMVAFSKYLGNSHHVLAGQKTVAISRTERPKEFHKFSWESIERINARKQKQKPGKDWKNDKDITNTQTLRPF